MTCLVHFHEENKSFESKFRITSKLSYVIILFRSSDTDRVSMEIDDFSDGKVSSKLVFHQLSEEDYGRYSCNATNVLGSAQKVFNVRDSGINMGNSVKAEGLCQVVILLTTILLVNHL